MTIIVVNDLWNTSWDWLF